MLSCVSALAQDGNAGISEATNKVWGYFDTGCDLMYAIGAVVGIMGAVKVFNKWNAGAGRNGKLCKRGRCPQKATVKVYAEYC